MQCNLTKQVKYTTYDANNSDYDGVNENAIGYNNLGACHSWVKTQSQFSCISILYVL